jgi:hypothetical protein
VADVARGAVDFIEHTPGIRDVKETVFDKRCCLVAFVAGRSAERDCIGELETLSGE